MNTVGKILVILNFLFAVTVGALLVYDIALRTQWKDKYFLLEREAHALKHIVDTHHAVQMKIISDYKQAQLDLDVARQTLKDKEENAKANKAILDVEIADLKQKLIEKDVTVRQAKELTQRQKDEIDVLNTSIENRQKNIVLLEADVKTTRLQAQSFESRSRDLQGRNEGLHDEIRKLTREIAAKDANLNPDRIQTVDPTKPNPPAVMVNGKVEKVEAGFVQLSLGTDHGLKKNHTLDVYRLQPEPKYLGMVRIVEANFHNSVGRLIPSGTPGFRTPLREGDLVTSTLTK